MKIKIVIVVPTIRENSIKRFIKEWDNEFFKNKRFKVSLILVEDNPTKTFNIKNKKEIIHYCWSDIEKDLKNDSWIIPRRTDCVRSYGYWKAFQLKPDMIITLDDDCYPLKNYDSNFTNTENFLEGHWNKLNKKNLLVKNRWISTVKKNIRPRGIPYKNVTSTEKNNIILNHGLWYNTPDFDGKTQLGRKKTTGLSNYSIEQIIPRGKYYPMCGMNLAWKPQATPALYFLLMGKDKKERPWGIDRFGDIWAGVIFKKISDHLNYYISSGSPIIWHDRESNPLTNIKKEKSGLKINEYLWQEIDKIILTKNSFKECYYEIAKKLNLKDEYWLKNKQAMKKWVSLF